ncbi:MAG TPA: hypothetical protein VK279_12460 [Solirubrobacteraceae bacterium]|nr:hypothetical protein [Solirubrobacteraceae bacterium]
MSCNLYRVVRRAATTLLLTAGTFLLLAPVALAESDHGEGVFGESNDKAVTNAGFILIAFFPLFIFVMSVLQWRLDKRKEARKAAEKARAQRDEWHGGW